MIGEAAYCCTWHTTHTVQVNRPMALTDDNWNGGLERICGVRMSGKHRTPGSGSGSGRNASGGHVLEAAHREEANLSLHSHVKFIYSARRYKGTRVGVVGAAGRTAPSLDALSACVPFRSIKCDIMVREPSVKSNRKPCKMATDKFPSHQLEVNQAFFHSSV